MMYDPSCIGSGGVLFGFPLPLEVGRVGFRRPLLDMCFLDPVGQPWALATGHNATLRAGSQAGTLPWVSANWTAASRLLNLMRTCISGSRDAVQPCAFAEFSTRRVYIICIYAGVKPSGDCSISATAQT